MRFSLDHLTAVDATPADLAVVAAETGYAGVCLFQQSMAVLPRMPAFDLVADPAARRMTRDRCRDLGVSVDLVYPFTLTGRSLPEDFLSALEAAAELGSAAVNVLLYDRDPVRRVEVFGGFCDKAVAFGLKVAVEFYPPSQVGSLDAASRLVDAAGRPPGQVGITVDLLHLMRSGGRIHDLVKAPPSQILIAQISDGPVDVGPDGLNREAAEQRRRPGEGSFDVAGFVEALPSSARISLEIPDEDGIVSGTTPIMRAWSARQATVALLDRVNSDSSAMA